MGLDVLNILSDESHYRPFLCSICNTMVPMDAMVTTSCSHPFCKECLENWCGVTATNESLSTRCSCPTCRRDISSTDNNNNNNNNSGHFLQQQTQKTSSSSSSCRNSRTTTTTTSSSSSRSIHNNNKQQLMMKGVDAFPLLDAQPLAHIVLGRVQVSCPYCQDWSGDYAELTKHFAQCGSAPLHHSSSRSSAGSTRLSRSRRERKRANSFSNSALDVSEHIMDNDEQQQGIFGAQQHPFQSRSLMRSSSAGGGGGAFVTTVLRRNSLGSNDDKFSSRDFTRDETSTMGETSTSDPATSSDPQGRALSGGGARRNSLNNRQKATAVCFSAANTMKEQANACFNKHDHVEARRLYTEGIRTVHGIETKTKEERQLIATLFCNRGATHLKDRNFDACIDDCSVALRYYPEYSKAYTRKWRGLIALGLINEAVCSTQIASQRCPNQSVHREEMTKTRDIERNLLKAQDCFRQRDFRGAKTLMDQLLRTSECPTFAFLSARTDAANGYVESAMERCQTAMSKTKPIRTADGLYTKGYVALMGTHLERARDYLVEALKLDPDDDEIKTFYRQCRKIGKAYTEAKEASAAELFSTAIELLSAAISEKLPRRTPIASLLYADRAEAHLQNSNFREALNDSRQAIESKDENVAAWITKTSAYIAMGRAKDAANELLPVKRSWGAKNESIVEAYKNADFEMRIDEADMDLRKLVAQSRPKLENSAVDGPFAPSNRRRNSAFSPPASRSNHGLDLSGYEHRNGRSAHNIGASGTGDKVRRKSSSGANGSHDHTVGALATTVKSGRRGSYGAITGTESTVFRAVVAPVQNGVRRRKSNEDARRTITTTMPTGESSKSRIASHEDTRRRMSLI